MQNFSTRLTLTMRSRIPIVLSLIAHKLLRTSMRTTSSAFPNLRLVTVLALTPLARRPTIPASTKLRAQFRQSSTSTFTIFVPLRKIRFPRRPTFLTFRLLPSSLRLVLRSRTNSAQMRHMRNLHKPATVSSSNDNHSVSSSCPRCS